MIVFLPIGDDVFNDETRLLHCCAAVLEVVAGIIGRSFQGAIETKGLGAFGTDPIVRTVPLRGRVQNFPGAVRDLKVSLCYGWSARGTCQGYAIDHIQAAGVRRRR